MLSDERINEIKERCDALGKYGKKWKAYGCRSWWGRFLDVMVRDENRQCWVKADRESGKVIITHCGSMSCVNDFIAHARTDIPDLLAEIERLRGELAARPNAQPMNAVIKNQPTADEWGTKAVGKQGVVWGQCVICGEDLDQQGGANGYNYCFLCSTGQQPHQRVKQ